MTLRTRHSAVFLAVAFASAIVIAGCDNSIEPFAETTKHFAIYGFLDADADTQFIRVEATRPKPGDEGPDDTDIASVSTQNLVTGDTKIWGASTIELDDGSLGLLYSAVFKPTLGDPYRIEVLRKDGATTSATTTIPDIRSFDTGLPHRTFIGTFEQTLFLDKVARRPEAITLNYDVAFTATEEPVRITLKYDVFGVPSGENWKIDVRLSRDRERINSRLLLDKDHVLHLRDVSMTTRLLSSDWPLVGSNETVNNVTEGFGFFGSSATHTVGWQIDSSFVRNIGFIDQQGDPVSGQ
jgi:hypothetical protein